MRLGIYGGTFSPPHIGHVCAARAFAAAMRLDKLLIIPTFMPPHKVFHGEASPEQRLEMCRLAFSDIEICEVSDIEVRRGGSSYTYMTLEELSGEGTELYFLLGTDMLLTLDGWRNFKRIFSLATVCYVRRERDVSLDSEIDAKITRYRSEYGARIEKIETEPIELSSTELRALICGGDGADLLPTTVLSYIESEGLYK